MTNDAQPPQGISIQFEDHAGNRAIWLGIKYAGGLYKVQSLMAGQSNTVIVGDGDTLVIVIDQIKFSPREVE